MIVKIIEADFAPGNDAGMFGEAREFREPFLGGELGFVRMYADGGVNPIVLFGERNGHVEAIGGGAAADVKDFLNAGLAGAGEHGVAVGVKLGKLEMGVRVDDLQKTILVKALRPGATRGTILFR